MGCQFSVRGIDQAEIFLSDALLRFLHRLSDCRIFAQQFPGSPESNQTFPEAFVRQKLERSRSLSFALLPFCLAHPFCVPFGHCLPKQFDRVGAIGLELQDFVRLPDCRIEVLIPDFQGVEESLRIVLDAKPDVLNHNTETVPRLYRAVRSGARYERTLKLLEDAKKISSGTVTKSGVMVGLGESSEELIEVFHDLGSRGVDILTVGQYLRPSKDHLPIARFYEPAEFVYLRDQALRFGFRHVESGPMVRSSYHAHEQADSTALPRAVS